MLAVRGRQPAFGRGTPGNCSYPKNRQGTGLSAVELGRRRVCYALANLARSPQAVELDLSEFAGRVPVELSAGSLFHSHWRTKFISSRYRHTASTGSPWRRQAIIRLGTRLAPEPLPEFVTIVIQDGLAKARSLLRPNLSKRRCCRNTLPSVAGLAPRIKQSNRLASPASSISAMMRGRFSSPRLKSKPPAERRDGSYLWPSFGRTRPQPRCRAGWRWRAPVAAGGWAPCHRCFCSLPSFAQRFVTAMIAAQEFQNADGIVRFRPTQRGLEKLQTVPDAEINWLPPSYPIVR